MIVWSGSDNGVNGLNTGGRYNPNTDSWTATTTTNAPTARFGHTAVWTGSEMIVWGGIYSSLIFNTGGRYNPSTDSWTATNTINAPSGQPHTAVWTGSEMIVWGRPNTGGRYCAQAGSLITLRAAKRRVAEINTVRLTWSGATSTDIDVYRNGTLTVT